MRRDIYIFILALVVLNSCDKPESPQFKYIENVVVELESLSTANLHADAVLFNPNNNNITIKGVEIDIMMDDKTIAILNTEYDILVKGNSDFVVPLDVKIKLKDLNLNAIGAALGLIGGQGQEIRYLGKIKVKAFGVPFSVHIDYKDNINIKI